MGPSGAAGPVMMVQWWVQRTAAGVYTCAQLAHHVACHSRRRCVPLLELTDLTLALLLQPFCCLAPSGVRAPAVAVHPANAALHSSKHSVLLHVCPHLPATGRVPSGTATAAPWVACFVGQVGGVAGGGVIATKCHVSCGIA